MGMIKLSKHTYGNGIRLGVSGTRNEIQSFCNGMYNHGQTDSAPAWLCDTFAYILTTEEKVKAFLTNVVAVRKIYKRFGHGKAVKLSPRLGAALFAAVEDERPCEVENAKHEYEIGGLE